MVQRLPEDELPKVRILTEKEREMLLLVADEISLSQPRTREINRLHTLL